MIYELMKDEVNLGKENMNMSQIEGRNSSGNKSPVPKKQKSLISYFFEDPRISYQIKDLEKFGITSNQ